MAASLPSMCYCPSAFLHVMRQHKANRPNLQNCKTNPPSLITYPVSAILLQQHQSNTVFMTHSLPSSSSLLTFLPVSYLLEGRWELGDFGVTDMALEGHFKMCPLKDQNGRPIRSLQVSSLRRTLHEECCQFLVLA